ncbi:MAG: NnrS family protein [Leptolyngbya sp. PLA3]|nr:NnrS family protein [Leptolyngbya sp. PL-A3]
MIARICDCVGVSPRSPDAAHCAWRKTSATLASPATTRWAVVGSDGVSGTSCWGMVRNTMDSEASQSTAFLIRAHDDTCTGQGLECRMTSSVPKDAPASSLSAPRPVTFVADPAASARLRLPVRRASSPFFRDAFRPFYLGGAIVAAVAVPMWLGMWYHQYFTPSLPALYWHMHEMVFGFVAAIIIGFLFTAARKWTGLPLPSGAPLAFLFALWIAARIGMFAAYSPATACIDASLLVIAAGVLAHKFIRARSWCSMPLVVVLLALASTNIAFHAAMHGLIAYSPMGAVELGLMFVVLVEMIVGGRVVPGFTANAIPGVRQFRSQWLHRGSFGLAAAAFVADALHAPGPVSGTLAMMAAAAVAAQALGWNPLATRGRPILWILHVGYGFIPVGLLLLGLSAFGVVTRSAAIHALAVGSMGGLIIGMITRTALGHSGRPIRADRAEVAAYLLVLLAAALRVAASLAPPAYLASMLAAGVAWTTAFIIYLVAYTPVLLGLRTPQPRT